jgi:hypothetical protein
MKNERVIDFDGFDLPEVHSAPPTAPRVEIVGDVCTSCEG